MGLALARGNLSDRLRAGSRRQNDGINKSIAYALIETGLPRHDYLSSDSQAVTLNLRCDEYILCNNKGSSRIETSVAT